MKWSARAAPAVLSAALAVAGCRSKSQGQLPAAPVTSAAAPYTTTYTTRFPLKESPISESGRWVGGKTVGLDWGDVATTGEFAFGRAGPKEYADSVALLTGNWGPNQTVEAVVDKGRVFRAPEVSLRLRSSLGAHRCTGYEISSSLHADDTAYLIIVRWNGPLADFTYLLNVTGKQYGVTTGDVVKATIVGDVITAYKNGVQMGQARDATFQSGQPGFGFNEGKNGDYGFTRVTVTARDSGP
ncbi:MAG: hypothetical protein WA891_19485 [Acidobacteriaceae bacterium]